MSTPSFVPFHYARRPHWLVPVIVVGGLLALGASARIEVPMRPVPMTLQTYALLVLGALLGWRLGLATVATYLALAAAGLPVLAGGGAGVSRLVGATGGYLAGFAVTVVVVGLLAERGWTARSLWRSVLVMIIGHAITLVIGVTWLATHKGWTVAWQSGLEPFLAGALVKSLLATGTVEVLRWASARRPAV
jgi:biotin transport system substrate-specific component